MSPGIDYTVMRDNYAAIDNATAAQSYASVEHRASLYKIAGCQKVRVTAMRAEHAIIGREGCPHGCGDSFLANAGVGGS